MTLWIKLRQRFFPNEQDRNLRVFYGQGGNELLLDFDVSAGALAVEVGGYLGQWASDVHGRFGGRVITAEPVSRYASAMRKRFDKNRLIEVHQVAVGDRAREEKISVLGEASSSHRSSAASETVQFVDIVDWHRGLGIDRVDILALNCEGGEYEILPRLISSRMIERFDNVLVQFHRVGQTPEAKRNAIRAALAETHTERFCYPFVWEAWRRSASQDAHTSRTSEAD